MHTGRLLAMHFMNAFMRHVGAHSEAAAGRALINSAAFAANANRVELVNKH
jgi:hypothetical protein